MNLSTVSKFVDSKSMVAVAGILMLAAARVAFQSNEITYFTFDRGLLFESANLWIDNTWLTMVVNTALILSTSLCWLFMLQIFNPFRALTTLPASFFMIMMLSVPDLTDQLYTGTLLAATLPGCVALLWSSFGDEGRLRHIFLLFAVLSALTMTQYCFAVYIPVFIIGCMQMKIFSMRCILAIVFGLVTPWWIVFGLGLASPSDVHMPDLAGFFTVTDMDGTVNLVLVSVMTAILLVFAWFANVMKIISFNINLRAFNGSISLIAVATMIAMAADFNNAAAYLPTLMLMAAYELAFMFGKSHDKHRFIPAIAIMLIYIAIFAMRMLM